MMPRSFAEISCSLTDEWASSDQPAENLTWLGVVPATFWPITLGFSESAVNIARAGT